MATTLSTTRKREKRLPGRSRSRLLAWEASVDGGSEFMTEFEAACAEPGIRLFVLPPRSPKLHAAVESANATHLAEFYEVTDAEPPVRGPRRRPR